MSLKSWLWLAAAAGICGVMSLQGQQGPPDFGPGRFPGPGPMGGVREETKLVKKFDKDGNGWLNNEERKAAREYLKTQPRRGPFGRGGPGGPPGFGPEGPPPFGPGRMGPGGPAEPAQPGVKLAPETVRKYADEPIYDMNTVRTLFLEFENADWEQELADFYNTDVEVPAKLTLDGKTLEGAGVHFRGMTSYMMVPAGKKRSLNVSVDFIHKKQRLGGYRTLNLLNASGDPTFLRAVLFHEIARSYIPAPKANFVRLAVNGENWGVYVNVQQFNTDLVQEWFGSTKGARWKVPGSPMGRGGLAYLGDDPAAYKRIYEIKSKDDSASWAALIRLCKVLNETPPEKLEEALAPLLDIDGTLRFLAIDKALINNDGYWTRASDYNIYMDEGGKFHMIPHDVNETLREVEMMGRGFRGGGGAARGVELDPLAGADDPNKALLNKLLAVPSLRARYLGYIKDIAEKWLDWKVLGARAAQYQQMIAADVAQDTKKLYSTEAFKAGLDQDAEAGGFRGPMGPPSMSLKRFAEERRAYLLNHPEVKKASAGL